MQMFRYIFFGFIITYLIAPFLISTFYRYKMPNSKNWGYFFLLIFAFFNPFFFMYLTVKMVHQSQCMTYIVGFIPFGVVLGIISIFVLFIFNLKIKNNTKLA
jgi:biotin transporter BioY